MWRNEINTTREDAFASLNAVDQAEQGAGALYRGPVWLNAVAIATTGFMTYSFCRMNDENQWALGAIVSVALLGATTLLWLWVARLNGVRQRVLPVTGAGRLRIVAAAVVTALVILAGRHFTQGGLLPAAYVAGIVSALVQVYCVVRFPAVDRAGTGVRK